VFSQADYELAARVLGLPVPQTPAEMAAATPITARVVREFARGLPSIPGREGEGIYTGATRSLNSYPDNNKPMLHAQLASRLRTEPERPHEDVYLMQLLSELEPDEINLILQLIEALSDQSDEHMDQLSSQRPLEYDTPNLGANYSVLNAPASSHIPASQEYQPLG